MRIWWILVIIAVCYSSSVAPEQKTYWKIEKCGSVWWFISPNQQPEFLNGVTTVNPIQQAITGKEYKSRDIGPDWALKTSNRIKKYGFKNCGAWCDPQLLKYIDGTICLNIYASLPNISSLAWETNVKRLLEARLQKNNQHLIGYYTDNELDWQKLEPYAVKYFKTTHDIIRSLDPNHLILGVRFNQQPPLSVVQSAKNYVDAFSFNCYINSYENPPYLEQIYNMTSKPLIITEFSYFSDDNRSNDRNTYSFSGKVNSQHLRAESYKQRVIKSASKTYIIGIDWFQWNDEPPMGRTPDGENHNFGIVDINDREYEEMTTTIKKESPQVNILHAYGDSF
jgi:hypothetical protein